MKMGELAQAMVGPAIGVAVAYGLQAPRFVVFASLVTGAAGYRLAAVGATSPLCWDKSLAS